MSESRAAQVRTVLTEIARGIGWSQPLRGELRLVEDLRLDSVGLLTLAVEVEDRFRVRIEADEEAALRTVGDLECLLLAKLAGRDGDG